MPATADRALDTAADCLGERRGALDEWARFLRKAELWPVGRHAAGHRGQIQPEVEPAHVVHLLVAWLGGGSALGAARAVGAYVPLTTFAPRSLESATELSEAAIGQRSPPVPAPAEATDHWPAMARAPATADSMSVGRLASAVTGAANFGKAVTALLDMAGDPRGRTILARSRVEVRVERTEPRAGVTIHDPQAGGPVTVSYLPPGGAEPRRADGRLTASITQQTLLAFGALFAPEGAEAEGGDALDRAVTALDE